MFINYYFSYPSDVDTRSKTSDNTVASLNYFNKPSLMTYKHALTISCSQVRGKTTFSKLKYILNELRNCLSQSKLKIFLIVCGIRYLS